MAPASVSYYNFDLRGQILENVRFVSWKSAKLRTLTSRDHLGIFKVIVTIDEDEGRRPFLAETGETFQKALEALHNKSADLVDKHLETVGFEYRRLSRKKSPKSPQIVDDGYDGLTSADSDGSASPTLALSEIESADETASDDDDTVSVVSRASRKRASKASFKSSKPQSEQPGTRPQSTNRVNDTDASPRQSPGRRPSPPQSMAYAPPRPMAFPPGPPPPLPGWRPTVSVPAPPPPPSMRFPAPPMPPPARSMPIIRQNTEPPPLPSASQSRPWDVRMAISFHGHGEARLLGTVRASRQELQQFAFNYMLRNPGSFSEKGIDLTSRRLSVSVVRVSFGQTCYDLSSFRNDDLSKLFLAAAAEAPETQMPLVEIKAVDLTPPPGPPPPPSSAPGVRLSPPRPSSPVIIMDD